MAEHILVAYDESSQADAALAHALDAYPEADVTVLHVSDPREWVYLGDMEAGYYDEDAFERARESAAELLEEAEAAAGDRGRSVETASEFGTPGPTIVSYAEEHGVDHIVLGSHGRSGLARFLLGSVAEAVARRSPTSVTIIRDGSDR